MNYVKSDAPSCTLLYSEWEQEDQTNWLMSRPQELEREDRSDDWFNAAYQKNKGPQLRAF